MTRIITRWEPMREFVSLKDAIDRLYADSFVRSGWSAPASRPVNGAWRLPLDVYATDDEFVINANVAGVSPDAVEITFENDVLTIKGEFPAPLENVEYSLRERRYGPFSRSLAFNVAVNTEAIEASFENGILTVIVPKAEAIKPKTIKVQAR